MVDMLAIVRAAGAGGPIDSDHHANLILTRAPARVASDETRAIAACA